MLTKEFLLKKKFLVIGIGEILWDLLPSGKMLGGAPTNFAFHANQLGGRGIPVSAVGDDELGNEIFSELNKRNIDSNFIQQIENQKTGVVEITFNEAEPNYNIIENVAWDNLQITDELLRLFENADAVCFGTLAQRSKNNKVVIDTLLSVTKSSCIKYFDINLRQNYYSYELINHIAQISNIIKLNEDELKVLSNIFDLEGDRLQKCRLIIQQFDLDLVVLTMGNKGSLLVTLNDSSQIKPVINQVVDTIGAGDSFSAAIIIGLLNQLDLKSLNEFASEVSSFVCSCQGATPVLTKRLKNWIQNKCERLEI